MLAGRVLQTELLCCLTHVVLVDNDKVDEADSNLVGNDAVISSAELNRPVARVEKLFFGFALIHFFPLVLDK